MKLNYYPDTDSLYIDLSNESSTYTKEVSPGILIDYDLNGNIVGLDIDNASKKLSLKELVVSKVPFEKEILAI